MERSSRIEAPVSETRAPGGRARLEPRVRLALARRKRLLTVLCVVLVGLVAIRAGLSGASAATLEEALGVVAARSGVRVDPDTVAWLDEDSGPLVMRGALFLARREGELNDLYYAEVRPGGEGTALDVAWLSNLTNTASAEEEQLVVGDRFAAYATRVGDRFDAVVVLDLRGEPASLTEGWSWRARVLDSITNLQERGRTEGFGVRRYQLTERAGSLRLERRDGHFVAHLGDTALRIDPAREALVEGAALATLQPQSKGVPDTVPWMVDTVRHLSFVGPEPIEWLENRVFAVKDAFQRAYHAVAGPPDTAAEVAEDLGVPESVSEERIAILTVTDPELGWPPAPLEPVLTHVAVEGEGRWIPVVDDPFVNQYPNAPPAFFQTFLRSDPERGFVRVYITIWDPRQVQLRIQSGVSEPESATGERGTGMVPRDPRTLRRLVGAFNGGFQALHGEFGMMADGRVYLPPKPWAATVAVFDDGRVGMGSWAAPDWQGRRYEEALANRQIPEDMVDMRQNLTSVVEDGTYNPWGRWYWGAAPRGAAEQTLTTRSAICLTADGFLAYFYGHGLGPEALGTAMISAGCRRSVHLDMNGPHAGFELFRPIPPGERAPPLERRPREDAEFEGPFPRTEGGWRLRARRAVRSMQMPFPRYSDRDARDFFYLTLRPVLPGPSLVAPPESPEGAGVFSAEGLPHAGWPHAFARTFLGGELEHRTWLVRIDPGRAVPEPIRRPDHRRALARLSQAAPLAAARGPHAVFARRETVGFSFHVGRPAEGDAVIVAGSPLSAAPEATAAMGVDGDGFLVYAERAGDRVPLGERLRGAGVEDAVVLPESARLAFVVGDAHAGVDGFAQTGVASALTFYAEERPRTEVMFEDNEPAPYRTWGYLQDRRVRYFPERRDDERPRFIRPRDDE